MRTASSKKILVTGFAPFGGEKLNPSGLLLPMLSESADVEVALLPVTFAGAFVELEHKLKEQNYDFVICLGQAGGRAEVNLERVAINMIDASIADESGAILQEAVIEERAPAAHLTPIALRKLCEDLQKLGHRVQVSNSAGLFVCNYVYFRLLDWISVQRLSTQALFVHLPYLPEQISSKAEGTPSMDILQMKSCILDLLNQCRALGAIK